MAYLELRGLSKSFPGVIALDDVDFDAEAGEIHALVGANGAGKSTLINLLSGVYAPESGEIRLAGRAVAFDAPRAAQDHGVATVYQEFSSIAELTVAENVFLGHEPTRAAGVLDRHELRTRTRALLDRHHLPLDPDALVGGLSIAQQQLVEIARALSRSARILILDEPTAVLAGHERENLFRIITGLAGAGLTILYVSHRLEEVFEIADRVTVLRDGRKMATLATAETDQASLVRLMIGHDIRQAATLPAVAAEAETVLEATIRSAGRVSTFTLRAGEILGVAGLVGAGRTRLARSLSRLGAPSGTTVTLAGRAVRIRSPRAALARGIVYLTEDRKRDGLFANLDILANTTAAALPGVSRWGVIDGRAERRLGAEVLDRLRLIGRGLDDPVRELSGGNQQKVLIGRALLCQPKVLICDEPTRGIDVGAKDEIYRILIDLAARGVGIVFISSEIKELLAATHRLVVMRDGQIVEDMDARLVSEEMVLRAASGVAA